MNHPVVMIENGKSKHAAVPKAFWIYCKGAQNMESLALKAEEIGNETLANDARDVLSQWAEVCE